MKVVDVVKSKMKKRKQTDTQNNSSVIEIVVITL